MSEIKNGGLFDTTGLERGLTYRLFARWSSYQVISCLLSYFRWSG